MQDPKERPDAYTLAATFAKLAAVMQEADAEQLRKGVSTELGRRERALASALRPHARAKSQRLPEEDLEDALLAGTLDVALLETPSVATASTSVSPSVVRLLPLLPATPRAPVPQYHAQLRSRIRVQFDSGEGAGAIVNERTLVLYARIRAHSVRH